MSTNRAPLTWMELGGLMLKRWWWMALLVVPFAAMTLAVALQNPSVADWLVLVLVGGIVIDTVRLARRLPSTSAQKWQRAVDRHIADSWPSVAQHLGLAVRSDGGAIAVAGISQTAWQGSTCAMTVRLPVGLGRDQLVAQASLIAEAFGALRATVSGARIDALTLRLDYADPLAEPFSLTPGAGWDGRSVLIGRTGDAQPWRLRLGPHTLVAGSSGSGKASLVWGLLLGLADPIHRGLIEVHGIDRKGGMELAMGRDLLTRFATDAPTSVQLLEEAVTAMQERARSLAGTTRQHVATSDSPHIVVLIDELAALTAYEADREMLRRANSAIATLASQGRAVGYTVFACLQDPRKETIPSRGLFTQTVALRLRDAIETSMVLGEGSVANGAACHTIPASTPGVAYVLPDEGGIPVRVRAGLVSDQMIRDAAHHYPAPRHIAVTVPAPAEEVPPRASSPRRPRRTTRKEATS